MKIFDEIKNVFEDRRNRKAETLTQKIEELDEKIYRTEIDIQGYVDDRNHNERMLAEGKPVDEFLVKYAPMLEREAEKRWVKLINPSLIVI